MPHHRMSQKKLLWITRSVVVAFTGKVPHLEAPAPYKEHLYGGYGFKLLGLLGILGPSGLGALFVIHADIFIHAELVILLSAHDARRASLGQGSGRDEESQY